MRGNDSTAHQSLMVFMWHGQSGGHEIPPEGDPVWIWGSSLFWPVRSCAEAQPQEKFFGDVDPAELKVRGNWLLVTKDRCLQCIISILTKNK